MLRPGSSYRPQFLRAFLALFILALVYALTLAVRDGLADVYSRPAKNFLQSKRDAGIELTQPEWQAIDATLREALRFKPDGPVLLTELGRLHRIQLEKDTLDQTEIDLYGNLALDYYERAAFLRPTWPWGWSSMALVRYELYQDGHDAYHQTLINATHFGPWQESIQRLVSELGLDTWDSLSPGAQQATLGAVDRALERQPERIDAVVETEENWQTICRAAAATSSGSEGGGLSRLLRQCTELGFE